MITFVTALFFLGPTISATDPTIPWCSSKPESWCSDDSYCICIPYYNKEANCQDWVGLCYLKGRDAR